MKSGFLYRLLYHSQRLIPDRIYVKAQYRLIFGRKLNLKAPSSFNEKLAWLKLYNRKPLYTKMADKYEVKSLITNAIGGGYAVPCYGVYNSFDEINFNSLPNQFVIKTTHDSGGVVIVKDKKNFDKEAAKSKIEKSLKTNCFYAEREWPYKNIRPRIIVDKFLDDGFGNTLLDYKFWCFNGVPTYMYCTVKDDEIFENFYDMEFRPVQINHGFKRRKEEFEKPASFELMRDLAKQLSANIPFIRIDFFEVNGQVYFGEFTFFDWGGCKPFADYNTDLELGKLINLNVSN